MASAAAALIARARRQIQHKFFEADAVRPDRAMTFDAGNGIERRMFDRYRRRGIIREASDGRYWMDVVAYDIEIRQRHARVRMALLFVIAALLIFMALSARVAAG